VTAFFQPLRSLSIHIPETGDTGHYFIILTSPSVEGDSLLVPICTIRGRHDNTCLLGVGDHAYIKQPSFVMYARMEIYKSAYITKQVVDDAFGYCGPVEARCFAYVCAGVEKSPFSSPKLKSYYRDQTARA